MNEAKKHGDGYINYAPLIHSWLKPEVERWFQDQCHNVGAHYYLFYKESNQDSHGSLMIATKPLNVDWKQASDMRVSPAWSVNQAQYRCYEICRNLPILKA